MQVRRQPSGDCDSGGGATDRALGSSSKGVSTATFLETKVSLTCTVSRLSAVSVRSLTKPKPTFDTKMSFSIPGIPFQNCLVSYPDLTRPCWHVVDQSSATDTVDK